MASQRLTREQSKANTREKLLDAAARVFAARGFNGSSVEEIAAEAGYSTGALYSNFDGKEDLFLSLLDREVDRHISEVQEAARRGTIAERTRGGAEQWMSIVEREPALLMLFVEFWAYGARDERVRERVADQFARVRAMLTRLIADSAREFDLELLLPAEQMALVVDALADGIARQKLADPDAVPDSLMGNVLSLLFSAASRQRAD